MKIETFEYVMRHSCLNYWGYMIKPESDDIDIVAEMKNISNEIWEQDLMVIDCENEDETAITFVKDVPVTYLFKNFNKASENMHRFVFKNFIFNRDDKIHRLSHVFYDMSDDDENSVWKYCIDECIYNHTCLYILEK